MTAVLVIECPRCGGLLLSKSDTRMRMCPHCDYKINVEKARRIVSASTAREASKILRELKRKAAEG